ncbi:signal recognition particle protein [Magnetofaba australis]|uniref:Signal recognition particle protein n=1 Tax=Magnetofaba australis IT-1 TaxID=1434232 RepID=A0A1Y2K2S0_9PROT|nr:signal recognition particle protein [Magnetofaba australis]OSM01957.1 putative signal recognition particle subunit FFH/SRP54 [Magnetofaba australis IT-1]
MFDSLSDRLDGVFKKLRGRGHLTEDNIKEALRDVRVALLEADVSLPVVKSFIASVKEKAVGVSVTKSVTPGQQMIKVVHDELVELMGAVNESLNLAAQPPAVVLMAGLQGSGKTTTTGKLAKRLAEREGKRVLVASLDVYRPAAMDQLRSVAEQAGVACLDASPDEKPQVIAQRALEAARKSGADVLFLDTAGRLHIDETLMDELVEIKSIANPVEILFVADSMTGQDAVNVAQSFNERLDVTGVVLTKTDGDARGGAALAIRHVTGKPIKFLGVSEKLDGIEPFHPDRVASRILGMGDVLTLVETAMEKVDLEESAKLQEKLFKSKGFTLEDFLSQMQQVKKMGSMSELVEMIPGVKQAMKGKDVNLDDGQIKRVEAIILSMTKEERRKHQILNASRKRRIANGAGVQVSDVNKLLKQFAMTQKMMKRFGKLGKKGFMRGGGLPGLPF